MINFQTSPDQYKHWKLKIDGPVAQLSMDVQEDQTLAEGYKLKLNSYDLGVDIELADAIQRLRFEHPEVRAVVITSVKPRIFCAGANIYMLGTSSHAFKVNFCKFTNETRCAIEDDSRHSGRRYIAALNGTASGGGYELAIACDEIYLVDDGNSAVSLPEVPLLGVLPGTGGLTRQSTRAGQNAQQRNFGKRHRRVAVVNQVDLIASNRQFVTTARRCAIQRRDIAPTRMTRIVFNGAARLVRKFAKVDFEDVRRRPQHVNVRAGAKDARLQTRDDDSAHLRVLEANSLNGVCELEIDTKVIRIQFQLVADGERHVFLHVH